jgi:ABC-type sugar transport system ATPase subunit
MVFQELSLVPGLTVAENIYLGHMPKSGGLISYKKANEMAAVLLERLGLDIRPEDVVENLTVAESRWWR